MSYRNRVIFFGTPEFAKHSLSKMVEAGVNVVAVVTRTDKPRGRSKAPQPSPVKEYALEHLSEIPLYQPEKASDPAFVETLAALSPDLFVVVAYGEILSVDLLNTARLAAINVHASLLPKWRGAAPIERSLLAGDEKTGVTIMHMVKKMDAGDMIRQKSLAIGTEMNSGELRERLQEVGADALIEVVKEYETTTPKSTPQDETLVTYAPKIELEDAEVDWSRPARELQLLIRAMTPVPGAWCWVEHKGQKKRLKILKSSSVFGYSGLPGTFLEYGKGGIIVSAGEEALRLQVLKLEGKKEMSAEEFTRGIPQDQFKLFL